MLLRDLARRLRARLGRRLGSRLGLITGLRKAQAICRLFPEKARLAPFARHLHLVLGQVFEHQLLRLAPEVCLFCSAELANIQLSELGVIHTRPLQDFILVETLVEPVLLWHLLLLGYLCELLFVRERQLRDQKMLGRGELQDANSSFFCHGLEELNLVLLFGQDHGEAGAIVSELLADIPARGTHSVLPRCPGLPSSRSVVHTHNAVAGLLGCNNAFLVVGL